MSDCSWRIKLLKISSRKLILVTVSQLNNSHGKKKKKKVEGSYCSLSSSTHSLPLRGLPAPWVGLLLGSCSARFHSSGKLLLFLFYYFLRDLHAGAGQISLKSQALDLQLTFQVQAQCLVLLFKVNSTLQKTKVASVTSLWSAVAFVWSYCTTWENYYF